MLFNFGDVIQIENEAYVYFTASADYVYLAKIYDKELTKELIKYRKINEKKASGGNRRAQNFLETRYYFTVLTTKEFEDMAVGLYNIGGDIEKLNGGSEAGMLNEKDLEEIKKDILSGPAPKSLKDFVESLD